MPDTIRVFDPTGHVHVTEVEPAVRPATLDGLRPGILENRKANARLLMETMVDALRDRWQLGDVTVASKPVAGPPSASVMETLTKQCDFVLVGSSD